MLPNGGAFAGWSDRGYISEYLPDGRCVLEALYVGDRFNSYRAYKFNFVGTPTELPALKTHAYSNGASLASMSSVFAVSWNGATEVASWTLYGSNDRSAPFQDLGSIAKSGFETTYFSDHFWAFSYAQANDVNGTSLGRSPVVEIILPNRRNQNITLVGLSINQQQTQRRLAVVVAAITLVGLVLSGILSMLLLWKKPRSNFQPKYFALRHAGDAVESGELEALKYNDESGDDSRKDSSDEDHADEEDKEAALARMLKSDPTISVTATEELQSPRLHLNQDSDHLYRRKVVWWATLWAGP